MSQDSTPLIICYSFVALASVWFFFVAFGPKYRTASRWLRSVHFVLGIIGLIWSALGFLLLLYPTHFNRQTRFSLNQWKSHLSGIAVGLLISLLLSKEFWQLSRHSFRFRTWLESTTKV